MKIESRSLKIFLWLIIGPLVVMGIIGIIGNNFIEDETPKAKELTIEDAKKAGKNQLKSKINYAVNMDNYIGKHISDILTDKNVEKQFKLLLKDYYDTFKTNMTVSSGMKSKGDYYYGEGNAPHGGGTDAAFYAINKVNGKYYAYLLINREKRLTFGFDPAKNPIPPYIEMLHRDEEINKYMAHLSSQGGFILQMEIYKDGYDQMPNEIRKSEIFNAAREYEERYFRNSGNVITNWKGYFTTIGTSKGGDNLRLSVKIGSKVPISFKEGYGVFEGINPSSVIYKQASEFKEGDCVIFSGQVRSAEISITESGAMRAPTYDFHFTNLTRCTN